MTEEVADDATGANDVLGTYRLECAVCGRSQNFRGPAPRIQTTARLRTSYVIWRAGS